MSILGPTVIRKNSGAYVPIKKRSTFENRKLSCKKAMELYPDKIPIIIEPGETTIDIDRHKYLLPKDLTFKAFVCMIRQRLILNSPEALFFFINDNIPSMSSSIDELYNLYKDDDGYLYIIYTSEATFG